MAQSQKPESEWINEVAHNGTTPQFSYGTLISALGFAVSVIYGIWALNQSQLAGVNHQIEQLRTDAQTAGARISSELQRRENELKDANTKQDTIREGEIKDIHTELDRRREQFVNIREFNEFKLRVLNETDIIRKQINVLESTRPTTGELQATSSSLRDRIEKLYEMIRGHEDWIRSRSPNARPLTPP